MAEASYTLIIATCMTPSIHSHQEWRLRRTSESFL